MCYQNNILKEIYCTLQISDVIYVERDAGSLF